MTKKIFSPSWKRSVQVRKQRKFRHNAPLHTKQKMLHMHLSADLRKKYSQRNILVKKGDRVKILKGKFAKKEGKVEMISLQYEKVYVSGIEYIKKDGNKINVGLNPSNLMIVELNLDDSKRKMKLAGKKVGPATSKVAENQQPIKEDDENKDVNKAGTTNDLKGDKK